MKLQPEQLSQNNYVLIEVLKHDELVPFVTKYLHKPTLFSVLYYLSLLVGFTLLVYFFVLHYHTGTITIPEGLSQISFGVFITLALVPVHEIIHAIAYRMLGAQQTSFDVILKKFIFLAVADRFVANKRELVIVALAPFTLITTVSTLALFFAPETYTVTTATVLMVHSMICSGDFALCSYFSFHQGKEIVTYDDKALKVSYFYERNSVTQLL